MEEKDLNTILISQIRKLKNCVCYADEDFVLADDLCDELDVLQYPYQIKAVMIAFCVSGSAQVSLNLGETTLRKNNMIMALPGTIVQVSDKSPDFLVRMLLFSSDFIRDANINLRTMAPIFKYVVDRTQDFMFDSLEMTVAERYLDLLRDTIALGQPDITRDLLVSFFRAISEMLRRRLPETSVPRTRQEEYFRNFMVALEKHHAQERSVAFYADALHITPKYLSTVIKEVSGKSAAEWIDDFVIKEAKNLLKYSSKSIQEITYALNFSTQSFFGKYFKRHTGMSPSEYRLS